MLSVSQLNRQARRLLESHFDFVWVEGEVSNFAAPGSGHWYFSLKDGNAQVRCAMFRNRNQRIKQAPANGDAVRLRCRVTLYEGRGEFQLVVEHLEPAGAGALQARFEQLKAKLLKEGLFEPQRKKPLPDAVTRLAVITSPHGAAIHDILTVLARRCPGIAVFVLPVAVQGQTAAGEISAAVARANHWHSHGLARFDALLVSRGGGSLEDLWAFNEEQVARAIAASELPVVSAIGHEVDFTIADMTADYRAATPSAAAELLSPDRRERLQTLGAVEVELGERIQRLLNGLGTELAHLARRLKHPGFQLREQAQRLDELEQRLRLAQRHRLGGLGNRLAMLQQRLQAGSPAARISGLQGQHRELEQRLTQATRHGLEQAETRLGHLGRMLDSLSPLKILDRGYAIVSDLRGAVVMDAGKVSPGDRLAARLAIGHLEMTVDHVSQTDRSSN
jgi:exodeoxyribonuclease VII large subunit